MNHKQNNCAILIYHKLWYIRIAQFIVDKNKNKIIIKKKKEKVKCNVTKNK